MRRERTADIGTQLQIRLDGIDPLQRTDDATVDAMQVRRQNLPKGQQYLQWLVDNVNAAESRFLEKRKDVLKLFRGNPEGKKVR